MSGESKSIIHSICKIQMMVKTTNKIWETGNVSIALVQFQNSFFNLIFAIIQNKTKAILIIFNCISSDSYLRTTLQKCLTI